MKNLLKVGVVIFAVLWSFSKCGGCDEDYGYSEYYDEADSSYDYENEQESDYSWVYGTWVLEEGGEKHIISFGENGMCIDTYESPMFGNQSEVGSFSIRDGRIKVDNGDGYPSYITIEGRSLKSGSNYYRKR